MGRRKGGGDARLVTFGYLALDGSMAMLSEACDGLQNQMGSGRRIMRCTKNFCSLTSSTGPRPSGTRGALS